MSASCAGRCGASAKQEAPGAIVRQVALDQGHGMSAGLPEPPPGRLAPGMVGGAAAQYLPGEIGLAECRGARPRVDQAKIAGLSCPVPHRCRSCLSTTVSAEMAAVSYITAILSLYLTYIRYRDTFLVPRPQGVRGDVRKVRGAAGREWTESTRPSAVRRRMGIGIGPGLPGAVAAGGGGAAPRASARIPGLSGVPSRERVQCDGHHDDQADHDLLIVGIDPHHHEAIGKDADQQGSHDGAADPAASP